MSLPAVLRAIARTLDGEGIAYRVIGAAALAAHGVFRSTQDLDLLVTEPRALDPSIWSRLALPGYEIDVRAGTDDDPLAGVVRIDEDVDEERDWETALVSVDIVVIAKPWCRDMVARGGPRVAVGDLTLESVSLVDLVLLKLYAGGHRDRSDLVELLAQYPAREWRAEVSQRVRSLPSPCRQLWAELWVE
jgi:hypothetical protein